MNTKDNKGIELEQVKNKSQRTQRKHNKREQKIPEKYNSFFTLLLRGCLQCIPFGPIYKTLKSYIKKEIS